MLNKMYLGIDGYLNGWCCCIIQNELSIQLHDNIDSVFSTFNSAKSIFIDIPIGLSSRNFDRKIDKEIRKLIPTKIKSSVFTPPCREALKMKKYQDANKMNKEITGKGISIQSWNLNKKINEVDEFLINNKNSIEILHESHPELCFFKSNQSVPLTSNKKTKDGILERIKILKKEIPEINDIISNTIKNNKPNRIKIDDILDSIILAICSKNWKKNGSRIIHQLTNKDEKDIPISIYY